MHDGAALTYVGERDDSRHERSKDDAKVCEGAIGYVPPAEVVGYFGLSPRNAVARRRSVGLIGQSDDPAYQKRFSVSLVVRWSDVDVIFLSGIHQAANHAGGMARPPQREKKREVLARLIHGGDF